MIAIPSQGFGEPIAHRDMRAVHKRGSNDLLILPAVEASGLDRLQSANKPTLRKLKLAVAAPVNGDTIWLAARVGESEARLHQATVVQIDGDWMFFEYAAELDLAATSGAPVLNAAGEVVGLNLGGGKMPDGKFVGSANPVTALRAHLGSVTVE